MPVPLKEKKSKKIYINKVMLKPEKVSFEDFRSYKAFLKQKKSMFSSKDQRVSERGLRIGEFMIKQYAREFLAKTGYLDTTSQILQNTYQNTLFLDATIKNYKITSVRNNMAMNVLAGVFKGGFVSIEFDIEWKILNFYRKPLAIIRTKMPSGQFVYHDFRKDGHDAFQNAMRDGMEYALLELFASNELLQNLTKEEAKEYATSLIIPVAKRYAQNINEATASSVTVKNGKGHGSGFIISSEGHVVTNYHVVADTSNLMVKHGETMYKAKILRINKKSDLALLKINPKKTFIPIKIASSNPKLGADVYAIGTPRKEKLSQTISKGIVSGIRKTGHGNNLIQTDASVNAGNSGGVLATENGQAVGVVTAKLVGIGVEGVAFGIPAHEILDKLKLVIK